ncbi:PREDICTED: uncharacterized protein LOC104808441 [Tarenaya hassleriana]|uniref:uncharacterized protein LOC104808441 n=1 Tax=Tarenaya hassleriana TaxID=28532 RepID=UPI00053C378B|nr:PREDICTED: uncharacterized protein LOC104808441 [Tarenaya hassleriana]
MRSDKKLWEKRCKFVGSGCNWRLRTALILNSKRWSVRKHNLIHSCKPVSESNKSMRGTKKLVRDYLKDEFPGKLDSTPSAHEIIDRVKAKYGTTVTYLTALRGKHKAESEIRGDPAEHFRKLPGWLYMLQKRNPGTIVNLELDMDGRSFKYLFIALGATVKGWNYMRKVVVIDVTFLTGQYKGTLVVATAQDGDHHQYPLAWGIIDREKDASWRWFMERLINAIPDGPGVVVISDRHTSIIKTVREVYKEASYGFCARHMAQNLKVKVNKSMERRSSRVKLSQKGFSNARKRIRCTNMKSDLLI